MLHISLQLVLSVKWH